ncbi:MAG: uncharacterized protein PWP39_651 [Pyrococcus sp.]|uniref:ATP-binding protein n=1 Tax=Pyrococcus sp. TaxID=33866 RepID=UPI00258879C5|nr:ATP-binding protein [Pyrococcus sp.]MDK2869416.1 uncharacterized protein [Pyrococcus sp.]
MKFGKHEVWEDVLDERLDEEVAPELYKVVEGNAPNIYLDSVEFFKRTYFTSSIVDILEKVIKTLRGEERNNVILIYSLFGGGKSHTLLSVYHALRNPGALREREVLEGQRKEIKEKLEELSYLAENVKARIIIVHGQTNIGQPSKPLNGKIRTVWGYIANSLGKYELVEDYDRNLTVPPIEELVKLFQDENVLLLIDEIAHHVYTLSRSANEEDRNYAENVANFLHNLAKALTVTRSIMILTLPMEGEGKVEELYDRKTVNSIWSAVTKVAGHNLYSPMRTEGRENELIGVLKKRIFKRIDEEEKTRILLKLREVMSNREIFGMASGLFEALEVSYPFHPEYIEVLRNIIERTGLQRTRDLIKITRIVVRKLINDPPGIIMPYHIDLEDEAIKGLLFGKSTTFADYKAVLEADINEEKVKGLSNPELAKIILKYIFLKTYPFDSPTPLPGFPVPESIARGVYEPDTFERNNWLPADIRDTVEEIGKSVKFMYLAKKDKTFWFWRIANVNKLVESKTRELIETSYGDAWRSLVNYADKFIREGRSLRGRSSSGEIPFFKKNMIIVTKDPQELRDTPEYKLEVIVRDDVSKDTLERLIFFENTSARTFRNTVVICYLVENSLDALIELTARVMACDEVMREIRSTYGRYGREVEEIQRNMVREIREKALEDLENQLITSFRRVAYPEGEEVKIIDATPSSRSVVENVYSALVSKGKIVVDEEADFEWLRDILAEVGIDFPGKGYPFSELRNVFKTNPKLPMIADKALTEIIRRAVEELKVGIERDGRIFFKKVYKEIPSEEEKGHPPANIEVRDLILPREIALQRQLCSLLNEEKDLIVEKGGEKYWIKVWYEIYIPEENLTIPLRSIVSEECEVKEDLDRILWGYIVEKREQKKVMEGEFEISVSRASITGKPGEEIEVEVTVKPISDDEFTVSLSSSFGELEVEEVELRGEEAKVKWRAKIPRVKREVIIKGKSNKGKEAEAKILLIPKLEDVIEVKEIKEEHKGYILLSVHSIKDVDSLDRIEFKGSASGSLEFEEPLWRTEFQDVDLEIFKHIVKEMKEFFESNPALNVDVVASEEVVINDLVIEKLRPLFGKVRFRLKRRES